MSSDTLPVEGISPILRVLRILLRGSLGALILAFLCVSEPVAEKIGIPENVFAGIISVLAATLAMMVAEKVAQRRKISVRGKVPV